MLWAQIAVTIACAYLATRIVQALLAIRRERKQEQAHQLLVNDFILGHLHPNCPTCNSGYLIHDGVTTMDGLVYSRSYICHDCGEEFITSVKDI